ncbi:uncharacterized protein LOC104890503 [Beta vulgaris subsp. vulgaris]|uniref:uncharacterized protein LOC104890503 n=1 Tax=Beta vulgaris subsp. vulgaris TaxID=3555 RepID=UPI0020366BF3|nr:uncharacterized protein LOC104890503 [Beta vulgaris subsp. vulgaris]
MSAAPKRGGHEEGVHSSSSSMRPGFGGEEEENTGFPRVSFGTVQESRPGLIPRPESRDGERRSPLHSMYKMASSMTDSPQVSHPVVGPEVRTESRDPKDIRENKGVESNRDMKVDQREVHHHVVKAEKESRLDESKEGKYEREGRNDSKSEVKVEKDVYGVAGSHPNWKEQHRGKKHPDVPGGGGMTSFWMNASQMRPKYDSTRDVSVPFLRTETNEAVGENRVDLKSDEKYKDKERKRKEGKHHDWPDSDKDRNDHKSNPQVGGSSNNDFKEVIREERESEQWGKERKDTLKEKERPKEREKDHVDREGRIGGEKEAHQNEKEIVDKPSVPENFALEQKKPTESWRNMEREAKERRKERDGDLEGERPEKRSRGNDKELVEGGADVDGAMDRERDAFSYGVQQRKRMLRPRGSPQVANRDGHLKSRGQDGEGSQGKPEVSTIYRVGECMQELTKLWKEYESSQADKNSDNLCNGPTLEIRLPAEHVTATNRQVRGGQLWGTDIYTDDSDLVAVLMHTGYCRPTASPPPAAIQELRATVRVLPPQDSYVSTLRNNVRSRAWGAAIGCSYRVERCCIMKKGGGTIDLEPCLTHTSTIEPTLAPVAVERSMTTRAAASNALRQQRFVREVTIQYNLCNEPWIKYSISIVADKGLKKPLYTSARLKKGEVLYLETHLCRYELCFTGEKIVKASSVSQTHEPESDKSQNHVQSANGERNTAEGDNMVVDMFRWSRCKKPLPQKFMRTIGIPLPVEHVEVLEENLDWEDVQWSQTGVWVSGKEYPLARVHFLSPN